MTAPQGMWCATHRAQVYARDLRLQAGAPLVYLARGGADQHREAARSGALVCPLPDCDNPRLIVRAGSRRDHFAHKVTPSSDHAPERLMHLQGKAMVAAWLRRRYPALRVDLEVPVGGGERVADVLAQSPTGNRMAFEVQYSSLTVDEWRERHEQYVALGIADVWLWGHIAPNCRTPRGEHLELERAITPPMLECARSGSRRLLWINPEEQLFAAGLIAEGLGYEHRLALAGPGQPSWAFFDDRSALSFAAPVEDWRLDSLGMVSPFLVQVEAQRAERERREREAAEERRREAERRAKEEQEREARRQWREANSDRLAARRAEHEARDLERWRATAPALLARCGGELPEAFRSRLKSDRFVYLNHEHWHALVYVTNLYGLEAGESTTYRDIARTVFHALSEAGRPAKESKWIYAAITGLLFHLRRTGLIEFEAEFGSWYIGSPIAMRERPPGAADSAAAA